MNYHHSEEGTSNYSLSANHGVLDALWNDVRDWGEFCVFGFSDSG
jgi:hypothetical protein